MLVKVCVGKRVFKYKVSHKGNYYFLYRMYDMPPNDVLLDVFKSPGLAVKGAINSAAWAYAFDKGINPHKLGLGGFLLSASKFAREPAKYLGKAGIPIKVKITS